METQNTKQQILTYSAALFTTLLWASAFPATRYILEFYSPESVMVLRFTTASITLIIVGIIKKIRLPKLKDMPWFLASGLSGVFLYSYLFNTGSQEVVAGVSSFIIASAPVFTLLLSRIFLKEKIKLISWIGVVVSFCGLAAVTLSQVTEFAFNFYVFLIICCAVLFGFFNIIVRAITKKYTALEATTYTVIVGTLAIFIFIPHLVREMPTTTLPVNLLAILMGLFPSALGFLSWSYALATAKKTAHVTVFAYLIPFISMLIAYLWLGETLTIYALIGGIIIIMGMVLTNINGEKNQRDDRK